MINFECIRLCDRTHADIPMQSIVCLGNFDGVHLAHRALLHCATLLRDTRFPKAARCVFCFREPSWATLSDSPPPRLSTDEEQLEAFYREGIDYVIRCDFGEIKDASPEEFVESVLIHTCHCVAAVCGFNYKFGKYGAGTPALLRKLLHAPVEVRDEVSVDGKTVSSTRIRELLADGNVAKAAELLCAPYTITAPIIHGKALGRKLGFPTINQPIPRAKAAPKNGVYLTLCQIDGNIYRGITNVGTHPTVDAFAERNCETHLLHFDGDLYGKSAKLSFLEFMRPEKKFASVDELIAQLHRDLSDAHHFFIES